MTSPILFAVDDDPIVLDAVARDLREGFGNAYRVVTAPSGVDALEVLRRLKLGATPVALLIVDQRMPTMTGVELLAAARSIYPDAKKVLLTAYADTAAAIAAINDVGLDQYLMKPWDPPQQHLIPVLQELLDDWRATAVIPYDGIQVAGTLWSAQSHDIKDFLARNLVPYRWLDLEQDEEAQSLVAAAGATGPLPLVVFPDGTVLEAPSMRELAERIGLDTEPTTDIYDLIIVGGGPAGLAAAVNASAEGIRTILIEREATGGQAGTSSRIENYLGFPAGITGAELARRATAQAQRLGAEILITREATGVRIADPYRFVLLDDGSEVAAKCLLIATGVSVRELRVPGIDELAGAGVYYGAALTEAANYRDRPVAIVGGANSAGQAAMLYSRYASRVYLIVRGASLEQAMSQYLVDQIRATNNITVRLRTEVTSVLGETALETTVVIDKDTGSEERLPTAAMAIFIGARPRTEFVEGVLARSGAGYILTGFDLIRRGKRPKDWPLQRDPLSLEASVPGVFAAGDVRFGSQARVGAAVGSGGVAVGLIREYLKTV